MKPGPYIVSNWVEGDQFYGRETLCSTLVETPARCVYLVGMRRIGKTSLLKRVARMLNPYALYCDLMQAAAHTDQQATLDERRLVRLMRRELLLKAAQSEALRETRPTWDRSESSLITWLEEASWAWEEAGLTLTLLWDEAEMLRRLPASTLMNLRALLQHSNSLRLVVCASKGLAALNEQWRDDGVSPFLFGFKTVYIAGLTDQAANELISQRGAVQVAPEVAETIRRLTGNHPFLIQHLCDRLFRDGSLRAPTERDTAVDPMMADLFVIDMSYLSPGEQAILYELAQHSNRQRGEIQQHTGLTDEALHSFAQGMLNLGYMRTLPDGCWAVGNEYLARWLRSNPAQAASSVTDQASLEVVDEELQRLEMDKMSRRRREQALREQAEQAPRASTEALAGELERLRAEIAAIEQQLTQRKQQTTPLPVLPEPLSEREGEVLRLLARGLRNAEIARHLTVSENTVKAHIKRIYRKLMVHDRVQAIRRARELGLIKP
jgi:DNA-binding NarL/FixJ family response regulator